MGFLCCFNGGSRESQHGSQYQQHVAHSKRPELASNSELGVNGRGSNVFLAASPCPNPSAGVVAGAEEEKRSSPTPSTKFLKLPPGAPRFSELYARLSHIRGSWHSRGAAAVGVLAQQLGLQLATLWALSSDGTYFVAQASGGPLRGVLRPGAVTPAALGDRTASSLQRVQASKRTSIYSVCAVDNPANAAAASPETAAAATAEGAQAGVSAGAMDVEGPLPYLPYLPYDLAELAAATGGALTDFAVLPLLSGGEVVGAVTLALHRALPANKYASQQHPQQQQPSKPARGGIALGVSADAGGVRPPSSRRQPYVGTAGPAASGAAGADSAGGCSVNSSASVSGPDRSQPSLTDRIRQALSRGNSFSLALASPRPNSASVDDAHQGDDEQQQAPPAAPACWLHSAACVYQLGQLAHFLGYGFFSDTEQSAFVARSCGLVSGVTAAPDVQALVNCLIGMAKGLIYQRFRLQAQCVVALVHSSGSTAAYFKQQRTPRESTARNLAGGGGGGLGGGGAGTVLMAAVQGRALSQRDMSLQQRLHGSPAAAVPNQQYGYGHSVAAAGGGGGGPSSTALAQLHYSSASTVAGGGGAGGGGGASSSLYGLSAVLLGRKTRSQSQMRMPRSVPLHGDPDGYTGCASETMMGTSVKATIISLSHTLLHDAMHTQPPVGAAIRNVADVLARETAPIRDISLVCRLCDSRFGPGFGPGEDSTTNSGAFAGTPLLGPQPSAASFTQSPHPHQHAHPQISMAPSMLRRSIGGRHIPLGSLVVALGLGGEKGAAAMAAAAAAGCGGAGGALGRESCDPGTGTDMGYAPPGVFMESHLTSGGDEGGISCPGYGYGHGCGGSGMSRAGAAAAGAAGGFAAGTAVAAAVAALAAAEPSLALYIGFREVLQESVLERVLEEMTQVVELVLSSVQQRLLGPLRNEWSAVDLRLLNPAAFIGGQSVLSQGGGGGGMGGGGPLSGLGGGLSRRGRRRSSQEWTEALGTGELWPVASSTLSFALEDPAPLSHLQVLVNSLHSTLSSIQVERALEEGGDSPQLANDMRGLELLQQIGRGGQGVVYRGRMHGIPVAVKVVPIAEGGGGMGPVDRDVAFEADNAEAARRAARRQRALLRDALEVAASAAVTHPHLVQLHTYFTDVMVVEYEGDEGRFRLMHVADTAPGDPTGAINLVLVLEYCDGGNLRQAMERGVFFRREGRQAFPGALPAARAEAAGAGGAAAALAAAAELQPNFEFIYLTLLEIALAIRHMHGMRLAHCDLKPSNVLLRTSPHDPRGFTCKLSDFGCVQLMREIPPPQPTTAASPASNTGMEQQQAAAGRSGSAAAAAATALSDNASAGGAAGGGVGVCGRVGFMSGHVLGTPSHLAPEVFHPGQVLDCSVDVYSFGMLMWEVLVGIPAMAGLSAARVHSYTSRGLRPQFPPNTPDHYRQLAHTCWAQDPRKRPTAAALVVALHKALMQVSPGAALEVRSMVVAQDAPSPPPAPHLPQHHPPQPAPHPQQQPQGPPHTPFPSRYMAAATSTAAAAATATDSTAAPVSAPHAATLTAGVVSVPPADSYPASSSNRNRLLNRFSSLGQGRRSVSNNAYDGSHVPQILSRYHTGASGGGGSVGGSDDGRRRSLSAYNASTAGGGGGGGGGASPLLLQLAQARMSRSYRSPEARSPTGSSIGAAPAGVDSAAAVSADVAIISQGSAATGGGGDAPVVPSYGYNALGSPLYNSRVAIPRPGSNGSISLGGSGGGGIGAGGCGSSAHGTEVCLATAADMVDADLVAAAAAIGGGRVGSVTGTGGTAASRLGGGGSLTGFAVSNGGVSIYHAEATFARTFPPSVLPAAHGTLSPPVALQPQPHELHLELADGDDDGYSTGVGCNGARTNGATADAAAAAAAMLDEEQAAAEAVGSGDTFFSASTSTQPVMTAHASPANATIPHAGGPAPPASATNTGLLSVMLPRGGPALETPSMLAVYR